MAKNTNTQPGNNKERLEQEKPKTVRAICDGALGTQLLTKGAVTSDQEYVTLLDDERGRTLVEEVK